MILETEIRRGNNSESQVEHYASLLHCAVLQVRLENIKLQNKIQKQEALIKQKV